jgi:phasin family protein
MSTIEHYRSGKTRPEPESQRTSHDDAGSHRLPGSRATVRPQPRRQPRAVQQQLPAARSSCSASRTQKQLANIAGSMARPNVDKLMEYARNLYDLAANMQREITSVMEDQYSTVRHNASGLIDKTGVGSPGLRRCLRRSDEADDDGFDHGLREHLADGQADDRHRRHQCQGGEQRHRPGCCCPDPEEVIRRRGAPDFRQTPATAGVCSFTLDQGRHCQDAPPLDLLPYRRPSPASTSSGASPSTPSSR